jgi:hypothetical protein
MSLLLVLLLAGGGGGGGGELTGFDTAAVKPRLAPIGIPMTHLSSFAKTASAQESHASACLSVRIGSSIPNRDILVRYAYSS